MSDSSSAPSPSHCSWSPVGSRGYSGHPLSDLQSATPLWLRLELQRKLHPCAPACVFVADHARVQQDKRLPGTGTGSLLVSLPSSPLEVGPPSLCSPFQPTHLWASPVYLPEILGSRQIPQKFLKTCLSPGPQGTQTAASMLLAHLGLGGPGGSRSGMDSMVVGFQKATSLTGSEPQSLAAPTPNLLLEIGVLRSRALPGLRERGLSTDFVCRSSG